MKTNFKRLLAVALSALLVASSFAFAAFADDAAAPANLAASATVTADGVETDVINDGDLETAYASEEATKVGYNQYGNEIVLTLAERSFVSEVVISAKNWAPKNAAVTYKVYVLDGEAWTYVATAVNATSSDAVIESVATFDAVMADAVKVVAEAVGYRWMPEINEIAIYAKDLGDDGFDDVFAEDWYAEAVAYVRVNGLMTGLDEVTFAPASYFTYAMMAQVIYNMAGAPEVDVAPTFADVDPEGWYADAIAWAEINGITAGNADGSFTPDAAITREDIAAYLYNYARFCKLYTADRADLAAFEDAADATTAMKWAVAVGLFEGRSETELAAAATATRAEVATILMRAAELDLVANYFRNVATVGTASASSVRGTANSADKAIDGNEGTYWQPISEKDAEGNFTGVSTWNVVLDEAYDISRLVLVVTNYNSWAKGIDYKIEALVNGSWKTITTVNDADAYAASNKASLNIVLDEVVTATELKITATNADAAEAAFVKATIYELQIIAAESGLYEQAPSVAYADKAADAEIIASSTANTKNLPANAVDGNEKTAWTSLAQKDANGEYNGANIVFDWGYNQHIKSFTLVVGNYANWGLEAGVDYVVEFKMDGKWVEVYSFNDADFGDATKGTATFTVNLPALVPAEAIRITGYNYSGSVKPQVYEFAVTAWDNMVINRAEVAGITGSFSGGANAYSGGINEILDGNEGTSAAWTVDSVCTLNFPSASNFDVLTVVTTNHNPEAPGFWGDMDLILNIEVTYGEGETTTIKWSQREACDNITDGKITVDIPVDVNGVTAIKITTESACKWFSYIYEISAVSVANPVAVWDK